MNRSRIRIVSPIAVAGLLTGCAIGFDHALFVTKSNIGLDVDTKPPTAELSIARREVVIAPAFERGQTPPVLAGFSTGNRMLFGFDVSSIFAGGDAAWTLTQEGKGQDHSAQLCLARKPEGTPHVGPIPLGHYPLPSKGEIRPFIFGTDTSFGLKAAWSGMTAQFPDSLKIGFNRKEIALAPVYGQETGDAKCPYKVEMPAFLATIEIDANANSPQSSGSRYRQSFATGKAATALAGNPDVKKILLSRLENAYKQVSYAHNNDSDCILNWLTEGDHAQGVTKVSEINEWLAENNLTVRMPLFLYDDQFKDEWSRFIKEKSITCP